MGDYEKEASDLCDSSSDEVAEDASSSSFSTTSSSSSSSSLCSHARGPLYGLSDLMAHLPIKRGLSKFYDGKSQSFSCLTSVRSIEDLRKPDERSKKRLKISKSYENDLDRRPSPPVVVIPKEMKKKKKVCSSLRRASYLIPT